MEIISTTTLWQGKYIKTCMITYRDRNGTERQWEAVQRINCGGVVIVVPITGRGEIILIRQFRPPLNSYVIELPAGLIDPGEDVLSAGKRELLEETGFISSSYTLLTGGVMSTGIDTDKWHIVLARDAEKAPERIINAHPPDESENIESFIVPIDQLYERLEEFARAGDEIDLRIFGILEMAKRNTE